MRNLAAPNAARRTIIDMIAFWTKKRDQSTNRDAIASYERLIALLEIQAREVANAN